MCGPWKISTEIESRHLEIVIAIDNNYCDIFIIFNKKWIEERKKKPRSSSQNSRSTILVGVARN